MRNFIAFTIIFISAIASPALAATAGCVESAEHDAVTYLLIDRTDKLDDTENLKQSLLVAKKMIQSGERLIVGVSTGSAGKTRVLMDIVKPKKSLWVSKLKIRAAEKKFESCFSAIEKQVIEQNEEHKKSALLETLVVVSKALKSDDAKAKRVILYSDMIQNSDTLSFYKTSVAKPASVLKKVEDEMLLSPFPGVEFHVGGVGEGIEPKKARAIEQFWTKYFEKAGGSLKYYGPVLFSS